MTLGRRLDASRGRISAPREMLVLACLAAGLALCRGGEDCPPEYLRFSTRHTFCQPKNASCAVLRRSVDQQDVAVILREHNRYRSALARGLDKAHGLPKSSRMMQLVWDEQLEKVAQKHADKCLFEHDCSDCRRVQNFPVGQNLYLDSLEGAVKAPEPNWTAAVGAWYEEIEFFKPRLMAPFVPSPSGRHTYGHFSQVVWGDSWKIGCGFTQFTEEKKFMGLYTCNYGPTGNVKSGRMYDRGEPCMNCPLNSVCHEFADGEALPGLCVMTRDEAPKQPPPDDATFYCSFSGEGDCAFTQDSGDWRVVNTLGGNWLRVELSGGQKSQLTLSSPFAGGDGGICFSFVYGKGPMSASDKPDHRTQQSYTSGEDVVASPLPPESAENVLYSMSLGWEEDTTVSYTFSVPEDAAPQFFQIKDLKAMKGACPAK